MKAVILTLIIVLSMFAMAKNTMVSTNTVLTVIQK